MSNINENSNGISIKKNLIWNSIGNFTYLFAQWITTYLVTKVLGYDNAGIFSLAMSLSNTFSTFALYGMRSFQVSDIKQEYNANTYIYSRIITCIVSMAICIIFTLLNSYGAFQTLCIIFYMIFKISETIIDVYHGIDQFNMRMDIIGKSYIYRGILANILFVVAIFVTNNLFFGIVALSIVSYLFIFLYDKIQAQQFYIKEKTSFNLVGKLLLKCLPVAIYTFIFTLFSTVPRYFLEKQLGKELLGIYASISLPVVLVQVFATYIFSPFTTIFADLYEKKDKKGFKILFIKITGVLVLLAVVCLIGAMIFGSFGLRILFGEDILEYNYLLIPLVVCTILTAFSWFVFTIIIVIRNFKALNITGAISAIVCLCGSSTFIEKFGLNGATYINALSLLVQIILMLIFIFIYLNKNSEMKK